MAKRSSKSGSGERRETSVASKARTKADRKAQKKLQEELRRRGRMRANVVTGVVVALIAAAGLVVVLAVNKPKAEVTLPNEGATEFCDPIQTFQIEDRSHAPEGQPVTYAQDPPAGGQHWGSPPPPDDGFYSTEIPKELTTHSLEHGQIVIWYNLGDEETARRLEDAVKEKKSFLVAVPRSEPLPEGARMALTAWGKSQLCRQFDLRALRQFQDAFKNRGPERVRMG